ncbi:MAG: hypothetical protein JF616_01740 [Fibrobacteres bacterium]|nr:hypothetical protein [Fibrobacterota bacterium]
MRNIERARKVFLVSAILLLALGCLLSGCATNSEPDPTVHFDSPKMNDSVVGPNVFVKLATTHFQFAGAAAAKRAATSEAAAAAGTAAYGSSSSSDVVGHIHLFLDKPVGLDVDAVEQLSKSDTVTLTGLTAGKHYLIAEGANANHDDIESMEDSVAFTVVIH